MNATPKFNKNDRAEVYARIPSKDERAWIAGTVVEAKQANVAPWIYEVKCDDGMTRFAAGDSEIRKAAEDCTPLENEVDFDWKNETDPIEDAPTPTPEKPMSAAAQKKQEQLAKQIAEVRRALTARNAGSWISFDGRIGFSLSKLQVTHDNSDSWSTYKRYDLATAPSGKLTSFARAFCEAHGLKELADIFDDRAIRDYVRTKTAKLLQRREELMKELQQVNVSIDHYEQMLPAEADRDTSADHEGDATEATGHYDEPTPPTASEY